MNTHTRATIATILLLGAQPGAAYAGARPYGFVEGIDSLPESTLELENWFGVQKPRAGGKASWTWWLGPVAGLTDQLEAGLFAIFRQAGSTSTRPAPEVGGLELSSLRLQVTWLLAPKEEWPVDVRVRGELGQPIADDAFTAWASVIAGKDLGPLNLTLNLGSWLRISKEDGVIPYLDGSLGASIDTFGGLRVGAEVFSSTELDEGTRASVGPTLAYGTGRIWLSSHLGVGLTDRTAALRGRIILGVLF